MPYSILNDLRMTWSAQLDRSCDVMLLIRFRLINVPGRQHAVLWVVTRTDRWHARTASDSHRGCNYVEARGGTCLLIFWQVVLGKMCQVWGKIKIYSGNLTETHRNIAALTTEPHLGLSCQGVIKKIYFFSSVQCRIVCADITYCVNIISCNGITRDYSRWTLAEIMSSVSELPEKQEAQLSQRDCATLCVTVYLAKSLKVVRNGTILKLLYGFLFTFYSNYGCIFSCFRDIQRQRMAWPWNIGLSSFKVIQNGTVQ